MGRKRRTFTDKFKAKVALEAVKVIKTLAELAAEYQVHPNQISGWKKQMLASAPDLFASGKKRHAKTEEELTAPLYEEIRRLKRDVMRLIQSRSRCHSGARCHLPTMTVLYPASFNRRAIVVSVFGRGPSPLLSSPNRS